MTTEVVQTGPDTKNIYVIDPSTGEILEPETARARIVVKEVVRLGSRISDIYVIESPGGKILEEETADVREVEMQKLFRSRPLSKQENVVSHSTCKWCGEEFHPLKDDPERCGSCRSQQKIHPDSPFPRATVEEDRRAGKLRSRRSVRRG